MAKRKNKKNSGKVSVSRNMLIITITLIFGAGLFSGAGLAVFKSGSTAPSSSPVSTGQLSGMIKALEKQAAAQPGNAKAWASLGNAYYDDAQYEPAIRAYEKSLAIDPSQPGVITDMAVMHRRSGNPEKAVTLFEKAIAVDPQFETAYLNKGIVLVNDLGKKEEAVAVWRRLLAINPLAMVSKDQSVDQMIQHYTDHVDK